MYVCMYIYEYVCIRTDEGLWLAIWGIGTIILNNYLLMKVRT